MAIEGSGWEVFDFNKSTGEVSCMWQIPGIYDNVWFNAYNARGVEFSPSGQYLYVTDFVSPVVHQYDIWQPTFNDFLNSHLTFFTERSIEASSGWVTFKESMQLGPDGKIYVNEGSFQNESVSWIDTPDLSADDPNFQYTHNGINLNGGQARLCYPTFIANYVAPKYELVEPEIATDGFCIGSETQFTVTNSVSVSSWDFGDTLSSSNSGNGALSESHTYAEIGLFRFTVDYLGGCEDTAQVSDTIRIYPYPVSIALDSTICAETITLESPESGDSYIWSSSTSNTIGTNQTQAVSSSDLYKLLLTANGCTSESQYDITLESMPEWSLVNSFFICFDNDETVTVNPGSSYSTYEWVEDGLVDEPLVISAEGTYTVNLTGDSLCTETQVITASQECEPIVHIPNTFSPDGNSLNEWFGPRAWYVDRIEFTIYNEWGEPVFHTTELEDYWHGDFNGEPAPSGAYAYVCTYWATENGEEFSKTVSGNVTLLR
jgi:gliding motility-associated-like protein